MAEGTRGPGWLDWLQRPSVYRGLILALLWCAIVAALFVFRSILLPFVGAVFLSYVIEPVVVRLSSLRVRGRPIPRWLAVIGLYLVFFSGVAVASLVLFPKLSNEFERLSARAQHFIASVDGAGVETQIKKVEAWVYGDEIYSGDSAIGRTLREGIKTTKGNLQAGVGNMFKLTQKFAFSIVDALFGIALLLMLTAFISIDSARIVRFFRSMVPVGYEGDANTLLSGFDRGLSGVVRGQFIIMGINGVLTFIGLWVLDVKYALFLALVATVFYIVPIFGTIISSVPIVLVALGDSPSKAVLVLLWITAIHALEAYYLNPKILGDSAKIHPVLIVFALLAGEHLAGPIGALFAVPTMSLSLVVFRFLHRKSLELREAS